MNLNCRSCRTSIPRKRRVTTNKHKQTKRFTNTVTHFTYSNHIESCMCTIQWQHVWTMVRADYSHNCANIMNARRCQLRDSARIMNARRCQPRNSASIMDAQWCQLRDSASIMNARRCNLYDVTVLVDRMYCTLQGAA